MVTAAFPSGGTRAVYAFMHVPHTATTAAWHELLLNRTLVDCGPATSSTDTLRGKLAQGCNFVSTQRPMWRLKSRILDASHGDPDDESDDLPVKLFTMAFVREPVQRGLAACSLHAAGQRAPAGLTSRAYRRQYGDRTCRAAQPVAVRHGSSCWGESSATSAQRQGRAGARGGTRRARERAARPSHARPGRSSETYRPSTLRTTRSRRRATGARDGTQAARRAPLCRPR